MSSWFDIHLPSAHPHVGPTLHLLEGAADPDGADIRPASVFSVAVADHNDLLTLQPDSRLGEQIAEYARLHRETGTVLLIDGATEGWSFDPSMMIGLHDYLDRYGIASDRVALVTTNFLFETDYRTWLASQQRRPVRICCYDFWAYKMARELGQHGSAIDDAGSSAGVAIDRKVLSYNRVFKAHRAAIVLSLMATGELANSHVSFMPDAAVPSPEEREAMGGYLASLGWPPLTALLGHWPELAARIPLSADMNASHEYLQFVMGPMRSGDYDRVGFAVVGESDFGVARVDRVTEKPFKAIANFCPFILMGQQGQMARIRSLGFELDSEFDHGYDAIASAEDRMAAVLAEMTRWASCGYEALTAIRRRDAARAVRDYRRLISLHSPASLAAVARTVWSSVQPIPDRPGHAGQGDGEGPTPPAADASSTSIHSMETKSDEPHDVLPCIDFGKFGNAPDHTGEGWAIPNEGYTWTLGHHSVLSFPKPRRQGDLRLLLRARPLFVTGKLERQRVLVFVNQRFVALLTFDSREEQTAHVIVPWQSLDGRLVTTLAFKLPDATSPKTLEIGEDIQTLGIAVAEVRLLSPDEPVVPATVAAQSEVPADLRDLTNQNADATALMRRFESLGSDCELGMVQRAFEVHSLGLLKFAGIAPEAIARLLEGGLADVGNREDLEIEVAGDGEMVLWNRRAGLMTHSFNYQGFGLDEEGLLKRETRRLSRIAEKLGEDMEEAVKIFVFRDLDGSPDEAMRMLAALRAKANNVLLWVRDASPDHPAGTVSLAAPGLILAYSEKRAPRVPGPGFADPDLTCWVGICEQAVALAEAGDQNMSTDR